MFTAKNRRWAVRYTFLMSRTINRELSLPIEIPMEAIAAFCERWRIAEFAVFGSVLREDFGPESDVDVLVRFAQEHGWSVLDHIAMERELSGLLGRRVEIVNAEALNEDRNPYRQAEILSSARSLYAA